MRSPFLLIPFLLLGLVLDTGCMLPNRGNDDEESASSDSPGDEEGKDVPGSDRDDNSDNDGGADRAGGTETRNESGALRLGDQTLNSGEYADLYNVQVDQGQTIIVEMTSSDFDPYLILRPPGSTQVDNDDFNGDRTRSRIEYIATQSGNFDVIATSYAQGETGDYAVTMEIGEGIGGGAGSGDTGTPAAK